jgi:hypothetical protein
VAGLAPGAMAAMETGSSGGSGVGRGIRDKEGIRDKKGAHWIRV